MKKTSFHKLFIKLEENNRSVGRCYNHDLSSEPGDSKNFISEHKKSIKKDKHILKALKKI